MEWMPILMFAVLLALILCGYPVAFTLGGTAILFAGLATVLDLFHWSDLGFIPARIYGVMGNLTLVAVPLFIFMGLVLERTGIAEELLDTMARLLRRYRGSLALSVIIVGAILAASTGIVGATVVTMGVLSLPSMLQRGYDKRLATGTIASSGTLGQIIPPSIVLVLLGDMMNVDVGDLFVGAMLPGLLLVVLYLGYVWLTARRHPEWVGNTDDLEPVALKTLSHSLLPPAILMFMVLGSILFGVASPTEAAACGATGALVIALIKKRLTRSDLITVMKRTALITAMVFFILMGAQFFGVVFRGINGEQVITDAVMGLEAHPGLILAGLMVIFFVLGFFLDFLEICFIVIPIVYPILTRLGFDPLWVSVLIAVNLQTSFLTPPFGFSLFYLKGVAPDSVQTSDIYRGVVPFVGLQIAAMMAIAVWPGLVTWLPRTVFGP